MRRQVAVGILRGGVPQPGQRLREGQGGLPHDFGTNRFVAPTLVEMNCDGSLVAGGLIVGFGAAPLYTMNYHIKIYKSKQTGVNQALLSYCRDDARIESLRLD